MLLIGVDLQGRFPVQCSSDFNAFVVFVLACGDVFLYGGVFTIEMFSHTIVDKTRSAPDVVLVAVVNYM